MEYLSNLGELYLSGAGQVFTPRALLLILAGTLLGIVFGALPGLSSTMALALFTPLTFAMSPAEAIVFLIALYISSVYAGAVAAILVNIPGTPSSIATSFDGYPLSQRGEAGRAIGVATVASVIGGAIGLVVLMVGSPLLAQMARRIGSWEYAILALLALTLISYVSPGTMLRGLIAGTLGLLIATIGSDLILGYPRFTFGTSELVGGLDVVVLMIGLFGFAEVFSELENTARPSVKQRVHGVARSVRETFTHTKTIVRSSLIGVGIGVLPGAGGSIASIAAYGVSLRTSRKPQEYGKGSTEGLSAAESSNNASVGGALVPMMTLGIPGDPMTAVLIGALMIHGLAPGPQLYANNPAFVSAIFLGYLVALVFMLIVGLLAARPYARLVSFPRPYVMGVIALLCVVGSYSIQNSIFDVWVAVAAGFAGYLLKKVHIYPAPIVLGVVLGPLLEHNLRRALFLGDGSIMPFFTRPISLLLILTIILLLFSSQIGQRLRRRDAGSRA